MHRKRALILHLGVVEEEAFHPEAWRCHPRALLELVDNARNRHELDLVWIADDDVVQQDRAGRMIVSVDTARHDRHLIGVEDLRLPTSQRPDVFTLAQSHETPALDGDRFCPRLEWIDGIDLAVGQDEIGLIGVADLRQRPATGYEARDSGARKAHEASAIQA